MNVEVLGDDIYYGNSLNTIFAKQRILASRFLKKRRGFGDDVMLGAIDWGKLGKGIVDLGKGVAKVVSSPTGKAATAAALTSVSSRLSPTDKANIASAQEAVGLTPQWIPSGSTLPSQQPPQPVTPPNNMPLYIGGAGLLLVIALIALKK